MIGTIPSLEYLYMMGFIFAELPTDTSSSFSSLDIELSHDMRTVTSGIEVIGSMPNLTHLVIRIAETIRIQTIQYHSLLHDFSEFPMLKTVTIGMDPQAHDGCLYTFYDCVATLLPRAPSIVSLEVHHGHALGALRHLDGTGKGWGPQDVSCPSLKLLRIVFTSPVPLRYSAIAQSCLQLLEECPSLRIEWHEHLVPNAS